MNFVNLRGLISQKITSEVFLRHMKNKRPFSNHRKLLIIKFVSFDLKINGGNNQILNIILPHNSNPGMIESRSLL